MKTLMITFSILALLLPARTQAEECEIPGKTLHWIIDYCMHVGGSDDFLEKGVQACFDEHDGYNVPDSCENKKKYKMKLCEIVAQWGEYSGNAELCFKDPGFVPPTVRNEGI